MISIFGGKNMKVSNNNSSSQPYPYEAIKEICIKAGADDAGLVNLDRAISGKGTGRGFVCISSGPKCYFHYCDQ